MYRDFEKRLLDIVFSGVGLVLLSPLLLLAALAIKLTSKGGTILFRQERVGLNGKPFQILKLRTMRAAPATNGIPITVRGDSRVTLIGKLLRKSKIDELPQLWCVLIGDMSLVGPRPEVPHYVAGYSPEQREVLTVRPGLTDPASILYSTEEEVLAASSDPGRTYVEVVLPHKLSLSRGYLRRISAAGDLKLLSSGRHTG
jgi:lipopolysaccharide/colanic/teichoic acid biosynthesis glycosyltransferase